MAGAIYFIGAGEAKDVGVGAIKALSSLYKRAKFVKKEIQAVKLAENKGVKECTRNKFNVSSTYQLALNQSQSINAQAALDKKLRALQNVQKKAVCVEKLSDGRVRYYLAERASKVEGPTRGVSYVVEHNPKTGQVRS
ncbi:MAG: hypothetical protein L7U87_08180 [Chlamydiales bacterium]|nr:hypothetical protein [Chlamydiales bacterium]